MQDASEAVVEAAVAAAQMAQQIFDNAKTLVGKGAQPRVAEIESAVAALNAAAAALDTAHRISK